jgi:quinol monooxygenase YgiN
MTVARHYTLSAKPELADSMQGELDRLGDIVRALPGCLGFEMLRDIEDPTRFVFIEKWQSVEAHKAGGKQIPREAFAKLMDALAAPLAGSYLEYLKTV